MSSKSDFAKEQDLVAAFVDAMDRARSGSWTLYHETAGFDILAVHEEGYQVGIEAKLTLNLKVVSQALPTSMHGSVGPDYRAVLVPKNKAFRPMELRKLLPHLGLGVLSVYDLNQGYGEVPRWGLLGDLPNENSVYYSSFGDWFNWNPDERCSLPDYVPDIIGGAAAPLALTPWKIKAIKLIIILERRGFVCRSDMKNLKLSPTRWCAPFDGFLKADGGGRYIGCEATPDYRAQHPTNFAEIEADYDRWFTPVPADWEPEQLSLATDDSELRSQKA